MGHVLLHPCEKNRVVLRALAHLDSRIEIQLLLDNINPEDMSLWKVVGPHSKRGATSLGQTVAAYADFEQPYRLVPHVRKKRVIHRCIEVQPPFVGTMLNRKPR